MLTTARRSGEPAGAARRCGRTTNRRRQELRTGDERRRATASRPRDPVESVAEGARAVKRKQVDAFIYDDVVLLMLRTGGSEVTNRSESIRGRPGQSRCTRPSNKGGTVSGACTPRGFLAATFVTNPWRFSRLGIRVFESRSALRGRVLRKVQYYAAKT